MTTRLIGLTGGIGSGKSTVAHILQSLGAAVVDADAISRALTATGGEAIELIRRQFGPSMIDANGAMNRAAMRQRVFSDAAARQQLEGLLHPLIAQQTRAQAQAFAKEAKPLVVLDIPLLVESPYWRARLDAVWVVDCEPQTQIDRVMARSQLTHEAVQTIMAAQASRETRLHAADVVIRNEGVNLGELAQHLKVWLAREHFRFGL